MHFGSLGNAGSRVRGKPFKLFSDEIPRVDFNKAMLTHFSKDTDIGTDRHVFQLPRHGYDQHHRLDTHSLPSLNSPMSDRQGSSRGCRVPNEAGGRFGLDVKSASENIRQRLGIKDSIRRPIVPVETRKSSLLGVEAWVKSDINSRSFNESPNMIGESISSTDASPTAHEQPHIKRPSILQELLNEARKSKDKQRRILGLDGTTEDTGTHNDKDKNETDTVQFRPSGMKIKVAKSPSLKHGILKQSPLVHSASFSTHKSRANKEDALDTRLSHGDMIPTSNTSSTGIQFSHNDDMTVRVFAPRNQHNRFLQSPSATNNHGRMSRKKVNFAENDKSAAVERINISKERRYQPKTVSSVAWDSPESNEFNDSSNRAKQSKKAANRVTRSQSSVHKAKTKHNADQSHSNATVILYDADLGSPNDMAKAELNGKWKQMKKPLSVSSNDTLDSHYVRRSIRHGATFKDPDDVVTAMQSLNHPNAEDDPIKQTSMNKLPIGYDDLDECTELGTVLENLDGSELPPEIDRSMDGEELIKAYRLWDRKRITFPGGLRKIEAPDTHERQAFSSDFKQFKHLKIAKHESEANTAVYEGSDSVLVNSS